MKNQSFQRLSYTLLVLLTMHLAGCGGPAATGEQGATFNIYVPSPGGGGGNGNGNGVGSGGGPPTALTAPDNLHASAVQGVPGSTTTTTKEYYHVTWTNAAPDAAGTTVIEAKRSADTSFAQIGVVAGNVLAFDYNVGFLSADTSYDFRVKNVKGNQSSAATPIISSVATMSQLATPGGLMITAGTSALNYQWTYAPYGASEQSGFAIQYMLVFEDGTPSVTYVSNIASSSATSASINVCSGYTPSNVTVVVSKIWAVSANGALIASSNPVGNTPFFGCP